MPRNNSKSSIRVVAFSLMSGNWQKIAALYWIRDISHALGTGGEGNKTASNGGDRGATQPVTKSIPARETNILSDAKRKRIGESTIIFSPPSSYPPSHAIPLSISGFPDKFRFSEVSRVLLPSTFAPVFSKKRLRQFKFYDKLRRHDICKNARGEKQRLILANHASSGFRGKVVSDLSS